MRWEWEEVKARDGKSHFWKVTNTEETFYVMNRLEAVHLADKLTEYDEQIAELIKTIKCDRGISY